MKDIYTFVLDVNTDVTRITYAVETILNFIQQYAELTEEKIFETKVIFNELLSNAIIHGNKKDKTKRVFVKVGICNNQHIYAIIEDQGEGIEDSYNNDMICNSIRDHKGEDDIIDVFSLSESGRGLAIASSLCENMKRNRKGNKIVVLKNIKKVVDKQ